MLGTVTMLRRYPVKSMLGEAVPASDTAAGGTGAGVLITLPDGKTVWSADPDIDAVLSAVLGQPVTLTGTPPPNAELDRAVPEEVLRDGITAPVAVETGQLGGGSPAGTFFDFAPIHLLTTSTLDRIAELNPRGVAEVERYRPNIVVSTAAAGFAENDWAGHDLRSERLPRLPLSR
jgi:uncharacterized protein